MEQLTEAIKNKVTEDNKMACKDAMQIANDLNISPAAVGKELDRMKVKIKGCQLGCF